MDIKEKIKQYYEQFVGLPNNAPIVRNNIPEDAFVIVVLDILYNEILDFDITSKDIHSLAKYIVAPPDGGIDIFKENEDGDEYTYDIIQVKYSALAEQDISQCFANMRRTIDLYLKSPKNVTENLREIINATNFDETVAKNCTYYVVHAGKVNYCKGTNSNERIVTINDLETISNSSQRVCVPEEKIKSDKFNNFILYEGKTKIKGQESYLCNLNGYDLAILNNKYSSTEIGRNILFGQNLRDSLQDKKSKTYKAMRQTIDSEPENFWYYNNGITIIANEFDTESVDKTKEGDTVILREFSIINGAQTTSSLGLYLKEALESDEVKKKEKISQLKKVYVLTRILVIKDNDMLKDNITIYNNMQNPITSRDMVANRIEQKRLNDWLLTGEKPYIFVEIRRGSKPQNRIRLDKHQLTNNEFLAQLAFGLFRQPYVAKDKKKTLFNNDYSQKEYTINADYHKVFNYSSKIDECGILFKKSKEDINEMLFIAYLHKLAKSYLKKNYTISIEKYQEKMQQSDEEEREICEQQIILYRSLISINSICLFYNMALYYELKDQCSEIEKGRIFNYREFYTNKPFRNKMIEDFADKFISKTIEIIKDKSESSSNVNNWIRTIKNQDIFLKALRNNICIKYEYKKNFKEFVDEFKI